MELRKEFIIQFSGLSLGKHDFDFEINDAFFKEFEYSEIEKGDIRLEMTMDKSERMLILDFNFVGKVTVTCDRCGEDFEMPINGEQKTVIKFGESYEEIADDILVIPESEHEVDIWQMAFEMICLAIPIRKVHPDDENGSTCDKEALRRIDELSPKDDADPRWNDLLNINFEN